MAQKHVVEYYDKVCQQYADAIAELKDFAEECEKGMISPEQLESFKQLMQPILTNYQTLSYIMFLLNQPNRKEKQPRYAQQNKKLLKNCRTDQQVLQEGSDALQKMQSFTKSVAIDDGNDSNSAE